MFFERFGRLLFSRIGVRFFFILIALPIFLANLFLFYEKASLENTHSRFLAAMKKVKSAFEKKNRRERFLEKHTRPDTYFLNNEVESLSFLDSEKERLRNWIAHPAIHDKEKLTARLQALESDNNRLSFIEQDLQLSENCKETIEKQHHSIQVDNEDLRKILFLIEEIPSNGMTPKTKRPQLIITEFHLRKATTPLQNEIFEIDIDLLRREFL